MLLYSHRGLIVVSLAAMSSACPAPRPAPGPDVEVGSVSITPVLVHAATGTSFEMRALPRAAGTGYLVPEFLRDTATGDPILRDDYKVEWSIEGTAPKPALTPQPENHHRVTVAVPSSYPAGIGVDSLHYELVAKINGKENRARIVVLVRPDNLKSDRVKADDPAGRRPSMLLLDAGDGSAGPLLPPADCPIADSLVAFAGAALLGDLYSIGCHKLIRLEAGRRVLRDEAVDWGDFEDEVLDVSGSQGRLPVPIAFWLVTDNTVTPSVAIGLMNADAELADLLFSENRVGLRVDVVSSGSLPTAFNDVMLHIRDADDVFYCSDLQEKMKEFAETTGGDRIPLFDNHVIHVFYVPGTRLAHLRGQACGAVDGKRAAILIYMGLRLPTLLAHELGHVLGLIVPQHFKSPVDSLIAEGGVDAVNILAQGPNVLVGGTNDWAGASRSWLSVGQAYWMNSYSLSFLRHAKSGPNYDDAEGPLLPPPGATSNCSNVVGHRCPAHDVGTTP